MAIILEKSGDKHRINLDKGTFSGEIKLILTGAKEALWKIFGGGDIDLDLGCFYELRDGKKMLIDGLQFSHGRGGDRNHQTRQGCYTNLHGFGIKVMTEVVLQSLVKLSWLTLMAFQTSNV